MSFVTSLTVSMHDASFANLLLAQSDESPLSDGTYEQGNIVLTVTDQAGSITRYVTFGSFVIDMSGPEMTTDLCSNFTSSNSNLFTSANTFTFDFSAHDTMSNGTNDLSLNIDVSYSGNSNTNRVSLSYSTLTTVSLQELTQSTDYVDTLRVDGSSGATPSRINVSNEGNAFDEGYYQVRLRATDQGLGSGDTGQNTSTRPLFLNSAGTRVLVDRTAPNVSNTNWTWDGTGGLYNNHNSNLKPVFTLSDFSDNWSNAAGQITLTVTASGSDVSLRPMNSDLTTANGQWSHQLAVGNDDTVYVQVAQSAQYLGSNVTPMAQGIYGTDNSFVFTFTDEAGNSRSRGFPDTIYLDASGPWVSVNTQIPSDHGGITTPMIVLNVNDSYSNASLPLHASATLNGTAVQLVTGNGLTNSNLTSVAGLTSCGTDISLTHGNEKTVKIVKSITGSAPTGLDDGIYPDGDGTSGLVFTFTDPTDNTQTLAVEGFTIDNTQPVIDFCTSQISTFSQNRSPRVTIGVYDTISTSVEITGDVSVQLTDSAGAANGSLSHSDLSLALVTDGVVGAYVSTLVVPATGADQYIIQVGNTADASLSDGIYTNLTLTVTDDIATTPKTVTTSSLSQFVVDNSGPALAFNAVSGLFNNSGIGCANVTLTEKVSGVHGNVTVSGALAGRQLLLSNDGTTYSETLTLSSRDDAYDISFGYSGAATPIALVSNGSVSKFADNSLSFTVTDSAQNSTPYTYDNSFVVDRKGPEVTVTSQVTATGSGRNAIGNNVNYSNKAHVTATDSNPAQFTVSANDLVSFNGADVSTCDNITLTASLGTADLMVNGGSSITLANGGSVDICLAQSDGDALDQGDNIVVLHARDELNNITSTTLSTFIVDRTAPEVTIHRQVVLQSDSDFVVVGNTGAYIEVSANDNNSTEADDILVTCSLNDSTTAGYLSVGPDRPSIGNFFTTVSLTHNTSVSLWFAKDATGTGLDQEKYDSVSLCFTDLAGNQKIQGLDTFYIDTEAPTLTVTMAAEMEASLNDRTNNTPANTDSTRTVTVNATDTSMQKRAVDDGKITAAQNVFTITGKFGNDTVFMKRTGGNYASSLTISGDVDISLLLASAATGTALSPYNGTIDFSIDDVVGAQTGSGSSDQLCVDRTDPTITVVDTDGTGLISKTNDLTPRIKLRVADYYDSNNSARPLYVTICGEVASSSTHASLVGTQLLLSLITDGSHNTSNAATTNQSITSTDNSATVVYQMSLNDIGDFSVNNHEHETDEEIGLGQYSVSLYVTDSAGNSSSTNASFTLDTCTSTMTIGTQVGGTDQHTNAVYPSMRFTPSDLCSNTIRVDARMGRYASGFYDSTVGVGLYAGSTAPTAESDFSTNFLELTNGDETTLYFAQADGAQLTEGKYGYNSTDSSTIYIRMVDEAAYNTSTTGGDVSLHAGNTRVRALKQ
jgi:large repetitive protein